MASNSNKVISIIEHSRISPPPGTVAGTSLPLTFFDLPGILYSPMQSLFFYNYPNCNPKTLIPNLKHSLSITLQHFFPFAGNLILYPPTTIAKHEIRYVDGDSVPITFVACNEDFDHLAEQNPINVSELLPLSAQLQPCTVVSGSIVAPILAIQVTFFQNNGICFGITRDHVVGDASTWVRFVRAWALITKTSSDEAFLARNSIPFFDRSVITDSKDLYNIYLSEIENLHDHFKTKYILPPQNDICRGSFVITQAQIQKLKKLVSLKATNLPYVSSFVVVSAYIWSCLAKVHAACGEDDTGEGELVHFACAVSARDRIHTIPGNYFGNCFIRCVVTAESAIMKGENGFLVGVELIGGRISEMLKNEEGLLKGVDEWLVERKEKKGQRTMRIAGTPKFSLHDIDFGWGMPKRTDYAYTLELTVLLKGRKDSEGGIEIGLSLPKNKMDAFIVIFEDGLIKN